MLAAAPPILRERDQREAHLQRTSRGCRAMQRIAGDHLFLVSNLGVVSVVKRETNLR
jgi:hypothetical protein